MATKTATTTHGWVVLETVRTRDKDGVEDEKKRKKVQLSRPYQAEQAAIEFAEVARKAGKEVDIEFR